MKVEAEISRLTREIAAIDEFFYGLPEDRSLRASRLVLKLDDMVRGVVLQLHTSIEEMLNTAIISSVFDVHPQELRKGKLRRSKRARALRNMLLGAGSIGFDMKLNLAVAIGYMNTTTQEKLRELNTLRNKCSHNWSLRVPVRRGQRPRQKKPPLLRYRGQDLHNDAVLEQFAGEYGDIWAKMFDCPMVWPRTRAI
jgi:hypothetical protein